MKIVITGGSGRLGSFVVQELLQHGHSVLSLDRVAPSATPCPSWTVDLTRIGDLYQALVGADAVVHLAAYMMPGLTSDSETFTNNVAATYNVLKSSFDLGVSRVVIASSIAAYGFIYAPRPWEPQYLPLDEQHPCHPEDPYGLSKTVGEQIADSFAAQRPATISSLRLAGVNFDLTYESFPNRWRYPGAWRAVGGFWTYVDARDAAIACRLAVEASFTGHQILNIAAPTSSMPTPTNELVRKYVGESVSLDDSLKGNWAGMDSAKAQRVLGFRAAHTWERTLGGDALHP